MDFEKMHRYFNWNDITAIISSISILIWFYVVFTLRRECLQWYKLHKKRPPGPVGLPIVGNLPFLGAEPHKTLWNMRKKYGDIISVYLGPQHTVVLNEYKVMKEVLSHPGSLDRAPTFFSHIKPAGFPTENGERWVEQRRFTMSAAKMVGLGKDGWGVLIMEELSHLIKKLQEIKGKPYDISKDLLSSLNTSILSLLIGRRLSEDEFDKIQLSSEFSHVALAVIGPSSPTTLIPGLRKIYETFNIAGHGAAREIIHQFQSFIRDEIEKHKSSPLFRNVPDFINSYLEKISEQSEVNINERSFTESVLEGNLSTLFLGASDTAFASLLWIFSIMSKYQDIQEKVHKELMEVLGKDGQARYEERDKIPYTFAVLMEGQRYSSISPLTAPRRANQDISINGYIIPKGSEITTNLWGLHHDPTYWDKPEEFRPERFLMDGGTKINKHPLGYAPFSFGRRNCPGETIAYMELMYYFAEIIKWFQISAPPGVEIEFKSTNGLVNTLIPQALCFKERNI